jgi:hypothetical protein
MRFLDPRHRQRFPQDIGYPPARARKLNKNDSFFII